MNWPMNALPDIVAILRHYSAMVPDREAYRFLPHGMGDGISITYRQLDEHSEHLAGVLVSEGFTGQPVIMIFPPSLDFIISFFAVLKAGAIAVPLNFARQSHHQRRLLTVLRDSHSRLVLSARSYMPALREAIGQTAAARQVRILAVEDAMRADGTSNLPAIRSEFIAFIQYTSGSTGAPKGVMVSHDNLISNEQAIQILCDHRPGGVCGGWVPHYHDMGLVGILLQPLFIGGSCVFMSPLAFIQRPIRWLRMLSEYQIVTTAAPNFAYDFCVERCKDQELEGLDLSHWRIALNGAEPIRWHSLQRFKERFAPYGFRAESFLPCYGMAEATLIITGQPAGCEATVLSVDKESLYERRQAVEVTTPFDSVQVLGCGPAVPDHEVLIVDPDTQQLCQAGQVGEIWVRGPSVAVGYWQQHELSEAIFRAYTDDGQGPCLRTGDLGFLHEGQLYVKGRIKDIVIVRGRTLYPQDIEYTVSEIIPEVQSNTAAVFALETDHEEIVIAVQELPRKFNGDLPALKSAIIEAVAREHDLALKDVRFIIHNSLPRTTSGKIQRSYCKQLYLSNQLRDILGEITADAL